MLLDTVTGPTPFLPALLQGPSQTAPTTTMTMTITTRWMISCHRRFFLSIHSSGCNTNGSSLLHSDLRRCHYYSVRDEATRWFASSSAVKVPGGKTPPAPTTLARADPTALTVSQYLQQNLSAIPIPEQQQQQQQQHDVRSDLHQRILRALEPVYGKPITVRHLQSFGTTGLQALAESLQRESSLQAQQQNQRSSSDDEPQNGAYVTVRFQVPHHRTTFDLPWYHGQTEPLLSVLDRNSPESQLLAEYLERACGGRAMCSTCHVYIDDNNDPNNNNHNNNTTPTTATEDGEKHPKQQQHHYATILNRPSTAEKDMLDLAFEPQRNSRLACQVRLSQIPPRDKLNNDEPAFTVIIPAGVNNMV